MTYLQDKYSTIFILSLITFIVSSATAHNLTCYQCVKNTYEECSKDKLIPCPLVSDRCVTHITKDEKTGFSIKRECGLGPCDFNDAMMDRGLGLDACDRTKDEYFCVFCCRENGCNKNNAHLTIPSISNISLFISFFLLKFIIIIN